MRKKLAVFPNVTYQYIIPKEMDKIQSYGIAKNYDWNSACEVLNVVHIYGIWVIFSVIIVSIIIVLIQMILYFTRKKKSI